MLKEHTEKDRKVTENKVKELEKKCNDHLKQFNKMFSVGVAFGHEYRGANASTATNGLHKTHKPFTPGQKGRGPPVRPVCGASNAPNSRLGHFLSRIINNFADCFENRTECRSSEEMRAAFSSFNKMEK